MIGDILFGLPVVIIAGVLIASVYKWYKER